MHKAVLASVRALILVAGNCLAASVVHAQSEPSLQGDNAVLSRPRPESDATGIDAGGFTLFPSVAGSVAYNDNIYDTSTDKIESPVLTVAPDVIARSNWARHALNLEANGQFQRYTSRSSENNDHYSFNGDGRLDLAGSIVVTAAGHYLQSTEQRGTAGDVFETGAPIRFHDGGGQLGVTAALGRVNVSLNGQISRITYDNVLVDDDNLSQTYRNRVWSMETLNVSYDLSPSIQPFIEADYERERYDQRALATSLDSHGTIVLGGINISLTKLLTGRVGIGYRWREYRNPGYRPSSGLTYDVALVWNPRTLLSVTLDAQKTILESPNDVASGIVSNDISVAADYELLRKLIVHVAPDYVVESYRGLDRTDHRFTGVFGVRYLMSTLIRWDLNYTLTHQNGSGTFGRSYHNNMVGLTLTIQR